MNSAPAKPGVGVIGLGMASLPHGKSLRDLLPKIDVRGVFSPSPERRQQFSDTFGLKAADSLEAIVTDPAISTVLLLTPPNARLDIVHQLASAGKHILMEKPVERTTAAATEIVSTCEQHNVKLGIVFQHRYRNASIALRQLLEREALGKIEIVQAAVPWWRDQAYYDEPGRGSYERDGGGVLISQAIHSLDLMLSLVGPVSTVASISTTTGFHQMESEDFVAAGLRFKNGAAGSLVATTASYPGDTESITLHGAKGSAILRGGELTVNYRDGTEEQVGEDAGSGGGSDPMAFPHDWHLRLIEGFINAVETDNEPVPNGRDALQVHYLIDALIESSKTGRQVSL